MKKEEILDWGVKQAAKLFEITVYLEWEPVCILKHFNLGVLMCKLNVNLSIY